jgi:hypothetical protein
MPVTAAAPGPANQKVAVIVDENHTQAQAQAGMPFLLQLQNTFGVTTHYTAPTHPSLPNYLMITGGSTFGVTDNAPPGRWPVQVATRGRFALRHRTVGVRRCGGARQDRTHLQRVDEQ